MTKKVSRRLKPNEAGRSLINLESVSAWAQTVRFEVPDGLALFRSDLNRALSENNLGRFVEAKSILTNLSANLKRFLVSQAKSRKAEAAQVHLLYATTLTALGRTCERLREDLEATRSFKNAEAEFRNWISEIKEPTDQMYLDYGVALFKIGAKRRPIQVLGELRKRGALNAEGNRYLGVCLGRLGKYKEAEECFRDALKQDPDHYMTHKALAELFTEQGKISEAITEYDTTFRYMADSGLLDDALKLLEKILKLTQRDGRWLTYKGEILLRQGDLKGAKRALDLSLKKRPRDAFANGLKGLALLALNRQREGVRLLERALQLDPSIQWIPLELAVAQSNLGHYRRALAALDKALAIEPDSVRALFHKGETLAALGRPEEALLALDKALTLEPNDALVLGVKGRVLRNLGQHRKALKTLQRSINLNPNVAWVYAELGAALNAMGENEAALQAVIDALAIEPDNVFALGCKGEILRSLGNTEEALKVMNQALALSPDDAWVLGTKGQVLRDLGRDEDAVRILEQAASLDRTLAWVHVELAAARYEVSDYKPALEALNNALRIQEESDWEVFKAQILCEIGAFADALMPLNRAIKIDKKIAEAFGLKGWAHQHLGLKHAPRALEAYESAVKLEADNLWWHKGIANALFLMGEKEKARAKYLWVVKEARRLAKKENDEIKYLSLIGWCKYRLDKPEEAVQLLNQVISLNADHIASQFDLALALIGCKRYRASLREYKRGVGIAMEEPTLRCHGLVAIALDDLGVAIKNRPESALVPEVEEALSLLDLTLRESSDSVNVP